MLIRRIPRALGKMQASYGPQLKPKRESFVRKETHGVIVIKFSNIVTVTGLSTWHVVEIWKQVHLECKGFRVQ